MTHSTVDKGLWLKHYCLQNFNPNLLAKESSSSAVLDQLYTATAR